MVEMITKRESRFLEIFRFYSSHDPQMNRSRRLALSRKPLSGLRKVVIDLITQLGKAGEAFLWPERV